MSVSVGVATGADADALVRFCDQLAQVTEDRSIDLDASSRGINDILKDAGRPALLAKADDGTAVGMAIVGGSETSTFRGTRIWWLSDAFVHEYARGQGVFSALLSRLSQLATSAGVEEIQLIVAEDNLVAQAAYDHLGFEMLPYRVMRLEVVAPPQSGPGTVTELIEA